MPLKPRKRPTAPPPQHLKRVAAEPAVSLFKSKNNGKAKAAKPDKGKERKRSADDEGTVVGQHKHMLAAKGLTKEQKKVRSDYTHNRARNVDILFDSVRRSAAQKFGDESVLVGAESDSLVVCVPMYGGHGPSAVEFPGCLPMEFLFGQTGFPLCYVIQLVGPPGVGKSAMVAECGRWFDLAGGGLSLAEAETKFNGLWYRSIMGDQAYKRMQIDRCETVEDWQERTLWRINDFKEKLLGTKKEPGPGRVVPVLHAVDSLTGKPSRETQEKISGRVLDKKTGLRGKTGSGSAGRGHPVEAMAITRWLRASPSLIDGWPFTLLLTNHLREAKDEQGNPERVKAGGKQLDFQEGFELQMKKVGGHKKMIQCAEFEGFPIKISCEKNSFSPTHRHITTRLLWHYPTDPETGAWHQETYFDWDWATVHLLETVQTAEKSPLLKASLKASEFHLDVLKASDIENLAWSKSVGMKSAKDAVPWSELGALIRENTELMNRLRSALRINERPYLAGDLGEQREAMRSSIE